MLSSHEDSTQMVNVAQVNLLSGLGFNSLQNVEEFKTHTKKLEELGLTTEAINILKKVKSTYNKDIISYNNLCDLAEKHNLFFGDSNLFIGKMPMENVKELASFDFGKFKSHYSCVYTNGSSVVEGSIAAVATTMVVAPLNEFKLKNVFISNSREVISLKGSKIKNPLRKCPADDPIVLLPFKIGSIGEVFFVVLTYWKNSNSIL